MFWNTYFERFFERAKKVNKTEKIWTNWKKVAKETGKAEVDSLIMVLEKCSVWWEAKETFLLYV